MTRFDVAVLSFRILAIYFLFGVLGGFVRIIAVLGGDWPAQFPALSWGLPLVLIASLGVLLFWKAPAIGRSLFKDDQPMSTASRPEIGALALRVCSILLFADCLSQLGQILGDAASRDVIGELATLASGAIAVLLYLVARPFSVRLFGAPVKPLPVHVQAVTFSVLGIWLVVSSLPAIAEAVGDRLQFGAWGGSTWAPAMTALLGLLLFLGGAGLSAFWYWIRHAGLSPRPQTPP